MNDLSIEYKDLHSLDECRAVVALQEAVWGTDGETVPASVLLVSAKRGGVLIGAWSADVLVGFVWSMPGVRDDGVRTHWSHMLAVLPAYREQRIGERLKLEQRERVLAQKTELVEWTFDPLMAPNAHFNLHVLGAVGASYGVDVYGALAGHLHRGTPTDRLIVEWWIAEPHVARRIARRSDPDTPAVISAEIREAPVVIKTSVEDGWVSVAAVDPLPQARRILVPVPPRFLEMQRDSTARALTWRLALRDVLTAAFSDGFRAVDFHLNRDAGGGQYLLART